MPITCLVVFFVSLAWRIWEIAYPINVDEAYWMFRGASFIRRMLEGDFAGTYLRHHPGVTNMWLTGTGHLLSSWLNSLFPNLLGVEETPYLHSCFSAYECPISLWIVPRLLQGLVTSACMVGIYLLTKKLLGKQIALVATSLLILEPFFLAYQRFITTDALQADFSILAVLSFLLYLKGEGKWQHLIVSGVFLGLATASKIPALFIVPGVFIWLICIELGLWKASFPRRGIKDRAIALTLWGLTAILVIILIWPTLWVNLVPTIPRIYADLLEESARGDLFFLGKVQTPGLGFYPLILLYRLSPILQFGIIYCLLSLIIPKLKTKHQSELIALFIVTIVILSILTTSDSKIGRYIVVIMPELAIIAAAGYVNLWCLVTQKQNNKKREISPRDTKKIVLILGTIQSIFLIILSPQYVSYYNPIFGSASVGQKLFHIGIGEGLDKAAQILNQYPNAESLKVASWYRWAFVPYFKGNALEGWSNDPTKFLQINRVITYVNQVQRNSPSPEFIEYFSKQTPVHTIYLSGIDYVNIYPGLSPLPEELAKIQNKTDLLIEDKLKLIGCDLEQTKVEPKEETAITLYWEFLESITQDLQLTLSLEDRNNKEIQTQVITLVNNLISLTDIPSQTTLRDVQQLKVNKDIPAGIYNLKLNWRSRDRAIEQINSAIIGKLEISR